MKSDQMQFIVGSLCFLALVFSVSSVTWCQTVDFTLLGLQNRRVSFGIWRYNSFALIGSSTGELWKVETCNQYPDDVEKDPYWKASMAFSVIAPVWGALSFCPLLATKHNPSLTKLVGMLLMLACLFQGLTLLFLKSNVCDADENPLFEEYPLLQSEGTLTAQDECSLGHSGIINIVSMCFWFLSGAVALAVPLDPIEDY